MKITAAVLRGARSPFSIEELELGDPRPDEVLVRMVAVGMCHTDLLAREAAEFFPGPQVLLGVQYERRAERRNVVLP